ncbi:DUF3800 domain-containing protein [Sphingomonas phyllosphaerae]|uniref:DUF3800 domain-containing protein n=1 Tax=Sphingomonas phyllosphaerae TaxID=257003 RepID=UPI0012DF1368|nr:DUF3800 domain-containing protein [Sphingomonas phyllosphaerae]
MNDRNDFHAGEDELPAERIDINVDEHRNPAIELWGLRATDEARTFYYDETNNHRLIKVTDDGFNVPDPRPFVLGGVAHPGPVKPIDLAPLRKAMGIQPNTPEIKFEHVAKGDFLTKLGSKRLQHFLEWLTAEEYLVHFLALDPVYFSFVDIIDSMPLVDLFDPGGRWILKNDLYRVLRRNLPMTQDILRRYSYPAVAQGDVRGFLHEVMALVDDTDEFDDEHHRRMLKDVLMSGRSLDGLLLLDDVPRVIMDDFRQMFIHRICLFKASQHILDREDKISVILEDYRFIEGGMPIELYRFVDSKAEPGVQLSDVVVGLLGACLAWLRDVPLERITYIKADLTEAQDTNRLLFSALLNRSISVTDAFVEKVLSLDDMQRLEAFLE